jgi:hypothetical protein
MESRGELTEEAFASKPPQYVSVAGDIENDDGILDDSIESILRDDIPDPLSEDREYEKTRSVIEKGDAPIEIILDGSADNQRLSTVALRYTDTKTSSINFEKLEDDVPEFFKRFSLPVESKFQG